MYWRDPKAVGNLAGKLENRAQTGIWLGRDSASDEHIVSTSDGPKKARTIKRRPEEERFDLNELKELKMFPWLTGNKPIEETSAPRQRYITAAYIAAHGKTKGCAACYGTGTTHSKACRARFASIFEKEEQDKPKGGIPENEKAPPATPTQEEKTTSTSSSSGQQQQQPTNEEKEMTMEDDLQQAPATSSEQRWRRITLKRPLTTSEQEEAKRRREVEGLNVDDSPEDITISSLMNTLNDLAELDFFELCYDDQMQELSLDLVGYKTNPYTT